MAAAVTLEAPQSPLAPEPLRRVSPAGAPAPRTLVLVNANAKGFSNWTWGDLHRHLARRFGTFNVVATETMEGARWVVEHGVREGIERIIAVGGDGTFHQALNAIDGHDVELGLVPLGAANDLAAALGTKGRVARPHRIDVLRVNGAAVATVAGMGVPADLVSSLETLADGSSSLGLPSRLLGTALAPAAAAFHVLAHPKPIRVDIAYVTDGTPRQRTWSGPAAALFVCNQPQWGGRFAVSHQGRNDDGVFEIAVLPWAGRARLVRALATMAFGLVPRDMLGLTAVRADVRTLAEVPFFGDGESLGVSRHVSIDIEPGARTVWA